MNKLLKFALGAAMAAALVNLLMAQRAKARAREIEAFDDRVGVGGSLEAEPVHEAGPRTAPGPSIH
jgi:hypothetical protein